MNYIVVSYGTIQNDFRIGYTMQTSSLNSAKEKVIEMHGISALCNILCIKNDKVVDVLTYTRPRYWEGDNTWEFVSIKENKG